MSTPKDCLAYLQNTRTATRGSGLELRQCHSVRVVILPTRGIAQMRSCKRYMNLALD